LYLQAHVNHKRRSGRNFSVRLVPRTLETIFDDLGVTTDVSLSIPRRSPVLLTLSDSGAGVRFFLGFTAVAFAVVLFSPIVRLLCTFIRGFCFGRTAGFW